eukprot:15375870-Heterocapsa_arctica.AAC.1
MGGDAATRWLAAHVRVLSRRVEALDLEVKTMKAIEAMKANEAMKAIDDHEDDEGDRGHDEGHE